MDLTRKLFEEYNKNVEDGDKIKREIDIIKQGQNLVKIRNLAKVDKDAELNKLWNQYINEALKRQKQQKQNEDLKTLNEERISRDKDNIIGKAYYDCLGKANRLIYEELDFKVLKYAQELKIMVREGEREKKLKLTELSKLDLIRLINTDKVKEMLTISQKHKDDIKFLRDCFEKNPHYEFQKHVRLANDQLSKQNKSSVKRFIQVNKLEDINVVNISAVEARKIINSGQENMSLSEFESGDPLTVTGMKKDEGGVLHINMRPSDEFVKKVTHKGSRSYNRAVERMNRRENSGSNSGSASYWENIGEGSSSGSYKEESSGYTVYKTDDKTDKD